jgi:hypothetical protein
MVFEAALNANVLQMVDALGPPTISVPGLDLYRKIVSLPAELRQYKL